MIHAKEYSKVNDLQRNAAFDALKKFKSLMTFKESDKILDIGCGPGNLTKELVQDKIQHFEQVIGMDVSEEMISFARENYPSFKFVVKDIQADPKEYLSYHQQFDHIFSFFCLNWTRNQKNTFENIGNMLRPGGDCLLIVLTDADVYESYTNLMKQPKWLKYKDNFERCLTFCTKLESPFDFVDGLLRQFSNNVQLEIKDVVHIFENENDFKDFVCCICPFTKYLPSEIQETFRNEMLKDYTDRGLVKDGTIEFSIQYLICYAVKSD